MATYAELREVFADSSLRNRCTVAVAVSAQAIIEEASPSADRLAWALSTLASPAGQASTALSYVLAKNKASTVEQITTASDATLQTQVDEAVDVLYP